MIVCQEKYQEALALYATEGILEDETLLEHIRHCDACKKDYELYKMMASELDIDQYKAPKTLHAAIMKRIPQQKKTAGIFYKPYVNVAAVLILVFVFGILGFMRYNLDNTKTESNVSNNLTYSSEVAPSDKVERKMAADMPIQHRVTIEKSTTTQEELSVERPATTQEELSIERPATTQEELSIEVAAEMIENISDDIDDADSINNVERSNALKQSIKPFLIGSIAFIIGITIGALMYYKKKPGRGE